MLLLNLILIGLAVALDPLPLTAFFVVLPSKRGVRKGAAFVFGWLVSLAIVVTITVVEAKLSGPASFLALFLYCVLASASYLFFEIYAVARPAESQALLGKIRTWIDTHTDQVIIVGSLLIGFWLIGDSLYLILA